MRGATRRQHEVRERAEVPDGRHRCAAPGFQGLAKLPGTMLRDMAAHPAEFRDEWVWFAGTLWEPNLSVELL